MQIPHCWMVKPKFAYTPNAIPVKVTRRTWRTIITPIITKKRVFLEIPSKTFNWNYIKKYLFVKFFCINKVKDLHHDERVKNESKMSRKNSVFLIDICIIVLSIYMFKSSTSNRSPNDSIFPFILRMGSKYCSIIRIFVLRYEGLSGEN